MMVNLVKISFMVTLLSEVISVSFLVHDIIIILVRSSLFCAHHDDLFDHYESPPSLTSRLSTLSRYLISVGKLTSKIVPDFSSCEQHFFVVGVFDWSEEVIVGFTRWGDNYPSSGQTHHH